MREHTITDERMHQIYRQIGANVKRIRQEKGVSQLVLSLAIGHKAVGTVSMAELGTNNKHFNIEHLFKISQVLETNICELLDGVDF